MPKSSLVGDKAPHKLLILDKSELQASNEITFTITASVTLTISKKLILVLKLCLETFDENSLVLT